MSYLEIIKINYLPNESAYSSMFSKLAESAFKANPKRASLEKSVEISKCNKPLLTVK